MRAAIASLAFVALLGGCRSLHEGQVKQRLMQTQLFQADIPASLAQVDAALADRRPGVLAGTCALCLLTATPRDSTSTVFCLEARAERGCVLAKEEAVGKVRFSAAPAEPMLPSSMAHELWRLFDADAAGRATNATELDVPGLASEEEERFEPRWSFWAGLETSVLPAADREPVFSFGGQGGVRRWLGYYLIAGAGLEYEGSVVSTQTFHTLGPQARLELTMWTDDNPRFLDVPNASFVMEVTPLLVVAGPFAAGIRGTIGIHFAHLGRIWSPIFFDASYQSLTVGPVVATGFRVALGLGI